MRGHPAKVGQHVGGESHKDLKSNHLRSGARAGQIEIFVASRAAIPRPSGWDFDMRIWTIARKDLRLLFRDPRAVLILLAMPLIFILVLGVTLGDGFGQKPAERLRVSVCILDQGPPRYFDHGPMIREQIGRLAATPIPGNVPAGGLGLLVDNHRFWYPYDSWSDRLLDDLGKTAGISVEIVRDRAEAQELVRTGKRA